MGMMNQIACCGLPERVRWSFLAPSVLPAVSKAFFVKMAQDNNYEGRGSCTQASWILALFFFFEFMDLNSVSVHKHTKKNSANIQPS